ncbi:MAG: NifU family protein [Gemmatimonadales bacterium]
MTGIATHDRIRRFVVGGQHQLVPAGSHRFASLEEARGVPVAEAVLGVPGIAEVIVEGNEVLALRREDVAWDELEEPVRYAVELALEGDPAARPTGAPLDDNAMFAFVARVLDHDINPAVSGHGGKVELVDVQQGVVVVRMMGGCQGCGMANVTLRQGIQKQLERAIPGFQGLTDITDHTAGTNPYF